MSRELTSEVYAGVAADVIRPIVMVLMELDVGTIAAHSGVGNFEWDGNLYYGVGAYGSLGEVKESGDLAANAVTASLSGIPQEFRSIAMGDHYQGRPAKVYKALLNEDWELIADPVISFEGTCDYAKVTIDTTISFAMVINSPLADWNRPCNWRYTNECQQLLYPGDLGFEFVAKQVGTSINWGS